MYKQTLRHQSHSSIKKFVTLLVLLLFLALLSACSFSLAEDITPPPGYQPAEVTVEPSQPPPSLLYPLVPPDPSNGKAIYEQKCIDCHGATGLGDGEKAVDLPNPATAIGDAQIARNASPAEWYLMVTDGNLERFMPPFQSLTDRQRWDVVAYSFSLSAPEAKVLAGEEIFQNNCADCHGSEGKGDGPQATALGVRLPDFSDQEYMANRSAADFFQVVSEGVSPNMPAYAEQLSEAERWQLTDYLRSLSFSGMLVEASQFAEPVEQQTTPEPLATSAEANVTGEPSQATPIAQEQAPGVVQGVVENVSGGDLPVGENVTLHAFDQMQLVYTQTVPLEKGGAFIFEDIEMPDGRAFLASIDYQGAIFGSDVAVASPEKQNLELYVEIYETTTDATILSIDRLHYFFEFLDEKTVQVVELYVISNPSNQTVVSPAEDQPAVTFSLPEAASNLQFEDGVLGGRYLLTEGGFGDLLPVRPGAGQHQIMFSYQMPFDRKLALTRPMNLDTNAIVILVPEDGIKIKGDTIQDAGTRDVQGVAYHMYNGDGLEAGQELYLEISGRPASSTPAIISGSNNELMIGLAALGVVLIVAGVWLFRRSQAGQEELEEEIELEEDFPIENAETVMDAILTLDDLYQDGQLPEEAYIRRRSELKARLAELLDD